jgi:hypothetical protein
MRLKCPNSSLFSCLIIVTIVSTLIYVSYDNLRFILATDPNTYNDFSLDIITEARAPKRYAIISTSMVDNSKFYYMLYIPICCIAWRRIGYEPLVMIVTNSQAPVSSVATPTRQLSTCASSKFELFTFKLRWSILTS